MNNNTVIVYVNDFSNGNVTVDAARLKEYFAKVHEIGTEKRPMSEIEYRIIKPTEFTNAMSHDKAVQQTIKVLEEALKDA